MWHNVKNALLSIWSNKIRSILTVLGVVIGVTSVTTLVSLGQGLQNDVSNMISDFGTDILIILSGKIDTDNPVGQGDANPAAFISGDILTLEDVATIETNDKVEQVTPISLVSGTLKYDDKTTSPALTGTYPNVLKAISAISLDMGEMYTANNAGNVIVLGDTPKKALFGDTNAIGKTIKIGSESFEVIGSLRKGKTASVFGSEFDTMAFIPFDTATRLNKDKITISRIIVNAVNESSVTPLRDELKSAILNNHNDEEDFSILTPDDLLGLFNTFLTLATTMVSAIASISLVVGGIGIMNIMLVTVTERTREIGLRKAVGATKLAILIQFLTEAVMVTLVGALIGLAIAYIVGAIVASQTELKPDITPQIIYIAVGISVAIGIIFGLWPAIRAANKDPIEALRYE